MAKRTVEQLESALEDVASSASTLASFARSAMESAGRSEAASDFHVVAMLAERIGSLADYMVNEGVIGDQGAWMLGPNFHASEVPHG